MLAGGGIAVNGLLAGCTATGGDTADPGEDIVRFSVTNEDAVSRRIEIEMQEDGEAVASGRGELPAADDQDVPFRYGVPDIGVPVTAVIWSDNASATMPWDPADCSELQVDVRIIEGALDIDETCQ